MNGWSDLIDSKIKIRAEIHSMGTSVSSWAEACALSSLLKAVADKLVMIDMLPIELLIVIFVRRPTTIQYF